VVVVVEEPVVAGGVTVVVSVWVEEAGGVFTVTFGAGVAAGVSLITVVELDGVEGSAAGWHPASKAEPTTQAANRNRLLNLFTYLSSCLTRKGRSLGESS
jgi:hypothetical protein